MTAPLCGNCGHVRSYYEDDECWADITPVGRGSYEQCPCGWWDGPEASESVSAIVDVPTPDRLGNLCIRCARQYIYWLLGPVGSGSCAMARRPQASQLVCVVR